MRVFLNLLRNSRGATAIEYALIASLISVAAIAGYRGLGDKVQSGFTNVDQTLAAAI